jgi:hypothetical protein
MLVVGRTGSGKTQFGMACLSHRSFDKMPWVIMNFKDDGLINRLPATHLDELKLPAAKHMKRGIWVVHPDIEDPATEDFLRAIWERTHVGLYVDEGLPLSQPRSRSYRRLLTQGRSRYNPVVTNTQRPVDLDRYAFSESEFIAVMELSDDREADRVYDFTGQKLDMNALPKWHAYYFNRLKKKGEGLTVVTPVPQENEILERFDAKCSSSQKTYLL